MNDTKDMNMRIAIVGTGALGGYYGAMLARKGFDIHFLMRHYCDHVRRNGLTVQSFHGNFHLDKVNCYKDVNEIGVVDLAFIAVKTTANDSYQSLLDPLMGPDTLALTAQNGLGNEERLAELFGSERVAGAVSFLCATRLDNGVIHHIDYGHIHLGNFQRRPDRKLQNFRDMFEQSGVKCLAIDDLTSERWKKLIINIPLNGLSALYNKSVNQLMADNKLSRLIKQLTIEVQQAALAYDVVIEDEVLEKFMINAGAMKPFRTSMQDDMLNHRPMEIEAIIGEPLRRGRKRGINMPETQRLYDDLIKLEERLRTVENGTVQNKF